MSKGREHQPCMLRETIEWLALQPGQVVVDMTVGMGGHGAAILERIGPDGRYIGIEWDAETLALARERLTDERVILFNESFVNLPQILAEAGVEHVDAVLLDAGVNLHQLTAPERSMAQDSELGLDMRMRRTEEFLPASVLVNRSSEEQLREILMATLQEREARRIARAIVRAREREPIATTARLSQVILSTQSPEARRKGRQPAPALLAIRIATNAELENLALGVRLAAESLRPATGRLVVLTFQSAEFRTCRQAMRALAHPCQCPPRLPCVCGLQPSLRMLTPHPPGPDEESLRLSGPQCRSCRLHAAQAI